MKRPFATSDPNNDKPHSAEPSDSARTAQNSPKTPPAERLRLSSCGAISLCMAIQPVKSQPEFKKIKFRRHLSTHRFTP